MFHIVIIKKSQFNGLEKYKIVCFRADVHNIRPAGQMWPAEAFYLARKAKNFIHSACLLEKTPSEWVQKY